MEGNVNVPKSNSAGKVVITIFIVLGAFFLLIGIGMIVSGVIWLKQHNTDDYVEIKAVISKIESDSDDDDHDVYVDYTYEGVTYEDIEYNAYDFTMYEGKEIDILCDPDNPENITFEGSDMIFPVVLFVIGGIDAFVAIIILVIMIFILKASKEYKNNNLS